MQLVKRHRHAFRSFAGLAEARELGERLEHMIERYARIVGDVLCDATPAAEMQSRVRLLERDLGQFALRVQDELVKQRTEDEHLVASA